MLITRELDYALRILRALSTGKHLSASELCDQEAIPKQFTYKILRKLNRADFVEASRGVGGGYRLSVDLTQKTLYDMICAVDGPTPVNACLEPGYQCMWRNDHGGHCTIHAKLQQIQQKIDAQLQTKPLCDFFAE